MLFFASSCDRMNLKPQAGTRLRLCMAVMLLAVVCSGFAEEAPTGFARQG